MRAKTKKGDEPGGGLKQTGQEWSGHGRLAMDKSRQTDDRKTERVFVKVLEWLVALGAAQNERRFLVSLGRAGRTSERRRLVAQLVHSLSPSLCIR